LQHGIALVAFKLSFRCARQQGDAAEEGQIHGDIEDASWRDMAWHPATGCWLVRSCLIWMITYVYYNQKI
jgi:hypothetical protein